MNMEKGMKSVAPPMLAHEVTGPRAWLAANLRRDNWLVTLKPEVLAELKSVAAQLCGETRPTHQLMTAEFNLGACSRLMKDVRTILASGSGFVVLDRLPLDSVGEREAIALYWLLASLLARPVAQKVDGTMIYDVLDTGLKPLPGSGIRPDKTNVEQNFHNDNAYSLVQPDYVGLLCMRPAAQGGESSVISVYTVHNELRRRFPDRLERLYRPFWIDRQKEHSADEPPLMSAPMFSWDGRLSVRMGIHTILNGYAMLEQPLDDAGHASIAAVKEVFADPGLSHHFYLERGQIQFVANLQTCHRRTAFWDTTEPEKKRRMVRLWLRDGGGAGYDG